MLCQHCNTPLYSIAVRIELATSLVNVVTGDDVDGSRKDALKFACPACLPALAQSMLVDAGVAA